MARNPLEYRAYDYDKLHSEYIPEAEKLKGLGMKPYIYEVRMQKAVSATAVEFKTNNTAFSVQTGGTYKKICVLSTSTDDNSAATGCVIALKNWGIDSNNNFRIISTAPSGNTASASNATVMYELNTFYAGTFGTSAQNCKGSCKVSMTGKSSQAVLTIKAGQNHSECARIWMPKNWRAKILNMHVSFADDTASNCSIYPNYYDAYENKQYDGSHDKIGVGPQSNTNFDSRFFPRVYGNDTTMGKLTFYGILGVAGAATINLAVKVMLWAEPTLLASGQYKEIIGE